MNKRLAGAGIALLLCACGALQARAEALALHEILVDLDPVNGEIRIDDRLSVAGNEYFEFGLAPWLEIESLTIDGALATPRRDGARWRVTLPDRRRHRLAFVLAGVLPRRAPNPTGLASSSGADGAYLPAYDGWIAHDPAYPLSYRLRVEVPAAHRAVATGRLVEERQREGRYLAVFEQQTPGEPPSLFAGPYQVRESLRDGLRLRTYFHAGLDDYAESYLEAARDFIHRYATSIGDYPYADFHVVSAPLPVGLGFPNLTYVGRNVIPLPFMRGRSLAHEVLHNWWGNGVAVDYSSGNWAEGLTTYMADYALERDRGEAAARAMRVKWLRDYAALPAARDRPVRAFKSKQHQASQVIGYNKVAFIFHMLSLEIGQQAFDEGIRNFWRAHKFGTAGWRDLQTAFEQSSARDLGWFFSQWLDRRGAPRPSLGAHRVERDDTGYRTTIEVLQPVSGYRFELPVLLVTENGSERHQITVSETLTRVQWATDARPLSIQFDPDSDVFRRLQDNEAPPILRDITLDARASTVIASADGEFRDIAVRLAARLFESAPRILDPAKLEDPGGALLLVAPNARLPELRARLQLAVPGELPPVVHSAAAWTARLPSGNPVLVVSAEDADELRTLLRPLPHYGGQSYVLFADGRALERGLWPIRRGALYRELGAGG